MTSQPAPDYFSLPLARFLDDTARAQSCPGGGSVTAVSAALGCALARMVAAFTLLNKKLIRQHAGVARLEANLAGCEKLIRELVGEDMAAYQAYERARKLPDDSEQSRALREQTARVVVAVPIQILAVSSSALQNCEALSERASRALLSDLLAAGHVLHGAAHAAAATARANLRWMDDPELADCNREQIARSLAHVDQHMASIKSAINRTLDLPT